MNAFVLIAGVDGIGESVRGVFSTIEKARSAAKDVPHSTDKTTWREVAENYWHAADEYVLIEVWAVNENIFEGMAHDVTPELSVNTKYFQDTFDFGDTFEEKVAVDNISDSDLFAIWHSQNLEESYDV